MSFGVPSDTGMEGPQRRRHDRAQRRKILIMGPRAAGMAGPQRRSGAPAGAEFERTPQCRTHDGAPMPPQRTLNPSGRRGYAYGVRGASAQGNAFPLRFGCAGRAAACRATDAARGVLAPRWRPLCGNQRRRGKVSAKQPLGAPKEFPGSLFWIFAARR